MNSSVSQIGDFLITCFMRTVQLFIASFCSLWAHHKCKFRVVSNTVAYSTLILWICSWLPPATKLRQGNIFRSVCQEFYHIREQCMLGNTGNKRVVHILLECILVAIVFKFVNILEDNFCFGGTYGFQSQDVSPVLWVQISGIFKNRYNFRKKETYWTVKPDAIYWQGPYSVSPLGTWPGM